MRGFHEAVLVRRDADAFKLLGLENDPDTYTVQDVDTAWRTLRSELHPDRPGGDADKFDAVRKAYESARFYALEPKPCTECDGTGKVAGKHQRGFNAERVFQCGTCHGRGQR